MTSKSRSNPETKSSLTWIMIALVTLHSTKMIFFVVGVFVLWNPKNSAVLLIVLGLGAKVCIRSSWVSGCWDCSNGRHFSSRLMA